MISTLDIECSETVPCIFIDVYQNNELVASNSFNEGVTQYTIEYEDTDEHTEQCVRVVMRGKTEEHTIVDDQDNIVYNVHAIVQKIILDDIDVTDLYVNGNPCYYHIGSNNNQNGPILTDDFYGFMGLNGEVRIEFYTPMWHWFNSKCS